MNKHTPVDPSRVEQHVLDLLNCSIDGALSAAGRAELDELLAGSAQVRDLKEELEVLAGILDGLPEQEPPEYLHHVIISRAVAGQVREPPVSETRGEKPGLAMNLLSTPWLRTGLAVAAGLLLTVGIYQTGSENLSPEDTSSMAGTVVKNPRGTLLDSTLFDAEAMRGKAELREQDGFLSLDVRIESAGLAVLKLGFPEQGLEFAGTNGLQNQAEDVTVKNGLVSVTGSGQQHYALLFKRTAELPQDGPTPLTVVFFAGDVLVHEAELRGSRR